MPSFCLGARDQNSDPHICTAGHEPLTQFVSVLKYIVLNSLYLSLALKFLSSCLYLPSGAGIVCIYSLPHLVFFRTENPGLHAHCQLSYIFFYLILIFENV